jgi:hypothetical protein
VQAEVFELAIGKGAAEEATVVVDSAVIDHDAQQPSVVDDVHLKVAAGGLEYAVERALFAALDRRREQGIRALHVHGDGDALAVARTLRPEERIQDAAFVLAAREQRRGDDGEHSSANSAKKTVHDASDPGRLVSPSPYLPFPAVLARRHESEREDVLFFRVFTDSWGCPF